MTLPAQAEPHSVRRLKNASSLTRHALRDEAGQAILETALSLSVTMAVVFWMFELCLFAYTCSVLKSAVAQGVRYAVVHGTDSAACSGPDSGCGNQAPYSNVRAVVTSAATASLHDTSAMTVTVNYASGTAVPGSPVTVKVVYTYVPYINLAGLGNTVSFSSAGQIVY
jgi:Flp pilus assembly protein TadG